MGATSPTLDPLQVADHLRPAVLRTARRLRREQQDLGVSATQVSLLGAIRTNPGIGHGELAAREGITPAALSTQIDRLEGAGYLTREREAQADRRRVGLRLTESGAALLAEVRSRRTAWLATHLARLDAPDLATIDAAASLLLTMLEEAA
jgi:DNA-binding MarR family transcriptional regulator